MLTITLNGPSSASTHDLNLLAAMVCHILEVREKEEKGKEEQSKAAESIGKKGPMLGSEVLQSYFDEGVAALSTELDKQNPVPGLDGPQSGRAVREIKRPTLVAKKPPVVSKPKGATSPIPPPSPAIEPMEPITDIIGLAAWLGKLTVAGKITKETVAHTLEVVGAKELFELQNDPAKLAHFVNVIQGVVAE